MHFACQTIKSHKLHFCTSLLLTIVVCGTLIDANHAAEFIPLGHIAAPTEGNVASRSYEISDDGRVVTGYSTGLNGHLVFRWTRETGMVALHPDDGRSVHTRRIYMSKNGETVKWTKDTSAGTRADIWTLQHGLHEVNAFQDNVGTEFSGISADGSTVTGSAGFLVSGPAALWTHDTGLVNVPGPAGAVWADGKHVSTDGSIVFGLFQLPGCISTVGCQLPYRWSEEEGAIPLTDSSAYTSFDVFGISLDGSVAVGNSNLLGDTNSNVLWRWTADTGLVILGQGTSDLNFASPRAGATVVSDDGSVIVGNRINDESPSYRWTLEDGLRDLPGFGGYQYNQITDLSADGNTILGFSHNGDNDDFISWLWNESIGTKPLLEILNEQGVQGDLVGWDVLYPRRISADGMAIAGYGINPDGFEEAWVVYLDPLVVPEATSLLLATLAVAGVATILRRKGKR